VDTFTYFGFKAIAAASHLSFVPVEMDDEGTKPEALIYVTSYSKCLALAFDSAR